jgi:hypothetical protein
LEESGKSSDSELPSEKDKAALQDDKEEAGQQVAQQVMIEAEVSVATVVEGNPVEAEGVVGADISEALTGREKGGMENGGIPGEGVTGTGEGKESTNTGSKDGESDTEKVEDSEGGIPNPAANKDGEESVVREGKERRDSQSERTALIPSENGN